jgi:capsule assembly protein Wzi
MVAVRIGLGCFAMIAFAAHARGVSPYLPLHQSPEIERSIERLLILADKPILKRPIAAATVFDALDKGCERDALLCDQVKRYLAGYMRTAGIGYASLGVGPSSGTATPLPNRHGMDSASAYELTGSIYWQVTDYVLVSGGVVAYEGDTTPTGSVVSVGNDYVQLDAGYRDHWLSPFTDSAMLLSTEAATMPSVTVSNYKPISRLGLQYEVFLAEMSESSSIRYGDGFTSGEPRLFGLHISIEPLPGWSLGVSRLMQYGGGERDDGFGNMLRAFFNPADYDNTVEGNLSEFGNQVAALSSRFLMQGAVPFAVYFEYAGEDTSTLSNLRLGNSALSAGIDFPQIARNFALTFEISEWQNAWYVHSIYQDGLRNDGRVIGHWGGDWRELNDGVGARSWMIQVGWTPRFGGLLEGTYRGLDNELYTGRPYERGTNVEVRYSRPWRQFLAGGELTMGQNVFGESYSRLTGFVRF